MRIVLVVPSLKAGGLERVVSTLANIGSKNYDIYLVSLSDKKPFYFLKENIKLVLPPEKIIKSPKLLRFFKQIHWLRNTVKKIRPDIVCSFGEKYNSFVLLSLKSSEYPIYVSNRASPLSSLNGVRGFINPILYKISSGVVLQTEKAYNFLKLKYGLDNVLILGNPIDLDYTQSEKKKIILNVGSFTGDKNQDWLINYFNKIDFKENRYWKLVFIGDGPKIKQSKKFSKELAIEESVNFLGKKKSIKKYYSEASIFAFTSTSEGFPNALAEAMAAGCACIAYDCVAGPSDIIDDGENGFLIPMGNEKEYIRKLNLLIESEGLRKEFGYRAIEKMKKFEANKIANKFFKFITLGS